LFTTLLSSILVNRLTLFGLGDIEVGSVGPYDLLLCACALYSLAVDAAPLAPEMSFTSPGRPPAELIVSSRCLPERGIMRARYLTKRLRLSARR
jgi:hypothetical protein